MESVIPERKVKMNKTRFLPNDEQKQMLDLCLMWSRTAFNLGVLECADRYKSEAYILSMGEIFKYFEDFLCRNPQDSMKNVELYGLFYSLSYVQPLFDDFAKNRVDSFPYQNKKSKENYCFLNRDNDGRNVFVVDESEKTIELPSIGKIGFDGTFTQGEVDKAVMLILKKGKDDEYLFSFSNEITDNVRAAASSEYMINESIAKSYIRSTIARLVSMSNDGFIRSNMHLITIYCKMLSENAIAQKQYLERMNLA